jgi:predicted heme/steroid binding protein
MSDAGLRQRTSKSTPQGTDSQNAADARTTESNAGSFISFLDVLRILITLVAASSGLSYYLTSGDSLLWGHKAWYTNLGAVGQYLRGPVHLTPEQLLRYDGSDETKPIYLAINGTIFDVSAGRHTYGPGGSYSVFAGRDATRAFVTGCFLEDRTADLRGAEEIYLPIEDLENEDISSGEKKKRAERERRDAKKKVIAEVQNWESFYKNSQKYFEVGKIVGSDDLNGPAPVLCDQAQKGRPKRSKMNQKKVAPGKPVQ